MVKIVILCQRKIASIVFSVDFSVSHSGPGSMDDSVSVSVMDGAGLMLLLSARLFTGPTECHHYDVKMSSQPRLSTRKLLSKGEML